MFAKIPGLAENAQKTYPSLVFTLSRGSVSPKTTQKRTETDLALQSARLRLTCHNPGLTIGPAKAHNGCAVCLMLGNIYS